jgi:protein HOOK3
MAQDTTQLHDKAAELKDEIASLKEKDRLHLEEIKKLLLEKIDLQSTDISQRERALVREKEFR